MTGVRVPMARPPEEDYGYDYYDYDEYYMEGYNNWAAEQWSEYVMLEEYGKNPKEPDVSYEAYDEYIGRSVSSDQGSDPEGNDDGAWGIIAGVALIVLMIALIFIVRRFRSRNRGRAEERKKRAREKKQRKFEEKKAKKELEEKNLLLAQQQKKRESLSPKGPKKLTRAKRKKARSKDDSM